jgi:hypothetical protein
MKKLCLVVTVLFLLAGLTFAEDYGVISGKVGAPGNESPMGSVVSIADEEGLLLDQVEVTEESGGYEFEPIPYGKYEVWASLEGYNDSNHHKVNLNRDSANVNLQLLPGEGDDDNDDEEDDSSDTFACPIVMRNRIYFRTAVKNFFFNSKRFRYRSKLAVKIGEKLKNADPETPEFKKALIPFTKSGFIAERSFKRETFIAGKMKEKLDSIDWSKVDDRCKKHKGWFIGILTKVKERYAEDRAIAEKFMPFWNEYKEKLKEYIKEHKDDLGLQIKFIKKEMLILGKRLTELKKMLIKENKLIKSIERNIEKERYKKAFRGYKIALTKFRRIEILTKRVERRVLIIEKMIQKIEANSEDADPELRAQFEKLKKVFIALKNRVIKLRVETIKIKNQLKKIYGELKEDVGEWIRKTALDLKRERNILKVNLLKLKNYFDRLTAYKENNEANFKDKLGNYSQRLKDINGIIKDNSYQIIELVNLDIDPKKITKIKDIDKLPQADKDKIKAAANYGSIMSLNDNIQTQNDLLDNLLVDIINDKPHLRDILDFAKEGGHLAKAMKREADIIKDKVAEIRVMVMIFPEITRPLLAEILPDWKVIRKELQLFKKSYFGIIFVERIFISIFRAYEGLIKLIYFDKAIIYSINKTLTSL